jgi:flagellar protein FliL
MAAKDEQGSEKEAEKKGGKMKLILIIVAAVVLTGGGTAAYFKFAGGGDHKKEAAAPKEGQVAPAAYALEPFIVNIYDGQDLRYLRVKIELEVPSEEAKAELETRKAQLRDAILVLLSTKTLLDIRDQQGKNQLRQEIFMAISRQLPPGKVTRVFFTDFVVQ